MFVEVFEKEVLIWSVVFIFFVCGCCLLLQDRSVQSNPYKMNWSGLHSHRLFFDSMCSVQVCKIKIVISKITNNNENKKNKKTKERKAVERDFYKKKFLQKKKLAY